MRRKRARKSLMTDSAAAFGTDNDELDSQLFVHADRERSGTLDSEEVADMLRSANIPE